MNFDVIIRGGVVVDGSKSAKRVRADVGIIADTIEAVGGLGKARARRVIDASGKIVAPGFIDMHGHSDFASLSTPTVDSKVRSGVTTEVLSQCGMSPFPLRGEPLKRRQDAFEGGKLRITHRSESIHNKGGYQVIPAGIVVVNGRGGDVQRPGDGAQREGSRPVFCDLLPGGHFDLVE